MLTHNKVDLGSQLDCMSNQELTVVSASPMFEYPVHSMSSPIKYFIHMFLIYLFYQFSSSTEP